MDALSRQLSLFFLDCRRERLLPSGLFPGYVRRERPGAPLEGEVQQCEERLLYLCDNLSLSLLRGAPREGAPPAKLAQVPLEHVAPQYSFSPEVLGSTFSSVVELLLSLQIQEAIQLLVPGVKLLSSLQCVTSLALEGNNLCRLLVTAGTVTSLTSLLRPPCHLDREQGTAALRCLGSLCCVGEGVEALLQEGGLPLVLRYLSEGGGGEGQRREAAGVLAQLTSPWLEDSGAATLDALTLHLPTILPALTHLTLATTSLETFLLCTAALANLTSLLPAAGTLLLSSHLLPALLAHPSTASSSPYIQDQVVTLVANMAGLPDAREQMVSGGVLTLLLDILSLPGCTLSSPSLALARERTLSKAAITLSRLCRHQDTAELALRLGAMDTLADLVTREAQGETVGLAVLAAARTLSLSGGEAGTRLKLGDWQERGESAV